MSRSISVGIAAFAVASLAACTEAPLSPATETSGPTLSLAKFAESSDAEAVVEGEILVKFKDGVNAETKAKGKGLGLLRKGYADAFVVVRGNKGQENAIANSLKNDADVEWAEPNYIRQPTAIRNEMWAFYNQGGRNMNFFNDPSGRTGPIPSSYASLIDADEDAIEGIAPAGTNTVTIGSIDTGVDFSHSELAGKLIAGKDWIDGDNDPSDTEGHGTHTTG
ncbi:MAG TPA: hypothetical protein VM053_00665, partial [Gemmatimonadaceae bacterium]|nr:hypothetical protein [Gemmatimonadaceae bacterium]